MDAAVRIAPRFDQLRGGGRPLPFAELLLGGVPRGAVVVLTETGGLETQAAELMNGLAEHGYESVAADLGQPGAAMPTDDALRRDVGLLLTRLEEREWGQEQVGLLGYGVGGRAALVTAAHQLLGAAISVDPTGVTRATPDGNPPLSARPPSVVTPWLGMFGDSDSDAGEVRNLAAALRAGSPVFTQVVSYAGLPGDFYRDTHGALAHAASYDAWQRTIEWLNARVVPRPTPLARAWQERQLVS